MGAELKTILALETRVWQALVAGDAAADGALLAPEFLGVYGTGFSGRDGHVRQLAAGPTVARFALSQARLISLAPGLELLAYRAEYSRAGQESAEAMYVSSIWQQRRDGWINIFSQDTAESTTAPV